MKARRLWRAFPGCMWRARVRCQRVHYRRMLDKACAAFETLLRVLKETHALSFQWTRGHGVWDLRPPTGWNKGMALTRLWRGFGRLFGVCLGDDVTDESHAPLVRGKGSGVSGGRRANPGPDAVWGPRKRSSLPAMVVEPANEGGRAMTPFGFHVCLCASFVMRKPETRRNCWGFEIRLRIPQFITTPTDSSSVTNFSCPNRANDFSIGLGVSGASPPWGDP
ncbi:MAG: hypothetical protein IPJ35_05500 [Elusimicrobia bacterium]|nr:hypothetical protein [Elusimicrobiota bacterium]